VKPVQPGSGPRAPDPGDQFLWDLLAADPALRLVTGDKRLRRDAGMQPRVISPEACMSGAAASGADLGTQAATAPGASQRSSTA
jgi:hypothetical protein